MSEKIDQFAALLSETLRLLARLNGSTVFTAAELSVSDWLVLRQIAAEDGLRQAALATRIGVTRQRAAQIVARLRERGLIVASTGEGGKLRLLAITGDGKGLLASTDAALLATLGEQSAKAAGLIDRATKGTRMVGRQFKPVEASAA